MFIKLLVFKLVFWANVFLTIEAFNIKIKEQVLGPDAIKHYADPASVTLDLSDNQIAYIQKGTFNDFSNLKALNLSFNRISISNLFTFGSHPKLENLNLSGNGGSGPISSNTTISVGNFYPNLKVLFLENLQASFIADQDWNDLMPNLEHLDLSGNEGLKIPDFIKCSEIEVCFSKLKYLTLSYNDFQSLQLTDSPNACEEENEVCIGSLSSLEHLVLSYNSISKFNVHFSTEIALPNLKMLDLSFNSLKTIDLSSKLQSVSALRLNYNPLESLSVTCAFPSLKYLFGFGMEGEDDIVSNYTFTDVCLSNLKELYLAINKFRELPENFLQTITPELEVLDLSYNKFSKFSLIADDSPLKTLRLRGNRIECDDDCSDKIKLDNFKQLKCLDIRNNKIGETGMRQFQFLLNMASGTSSCHVHDQFL